MIEDTAEYNYNLGYLKAVQEFLIDLEFISELNKTSHVFERLDQIMDKWKVEL
jgi:hypothetical protein